MSDSFDWMAWMAGFVPAVSGAQLIDNWFQADVAKKFAKRLRRGHYKTRIGALGALTKLGLDDRLDAPLRKRVRKKRFDRRSR